MKYHDWKKIELSVGNGIDSFTMKRGSFRYHQKLNWKKKLKLIDIQDREDGFVLHYEDHHSLYVQVNQDTYHIRYMGEHVDVNRYWIGFASHKDEKIYGCGETYSKLDLKGENVRIFVAEHQNSNRISKKIIREKVFGKNPHKVLPFEQYESYYVQPTFVSSDKYFVHCNTTCYAEFNFKVSNQTTLMLEEKPDFIVQYADSFTQLSNKLSNLLGYQKELPDWIYDGMILGIQKGTEVVDGKIQKCIEHGAKINGVWCQDWCGCRETKFGYQVMWNWKVDESLYPNLKEKIIEWNKKGVHFLGYINPFIALEKELYAHAKEQGYCVKDKEGNDYLVTITTFPAAMIDFTNPDAYAWYKTIIQENMIDLGMSGWMADFGEYLPTDCVLYSGEDPKVLHNQWPSIWAKLNQEAIQERNREDDIFFFTRAGYTETIRHSTMMWTGDQHVDFSVDDGLPSVIPATLSLAMSGYGITHSDVGGYTTIMHMRRNKELLAKWLQMNVYSPLLRSHEGNQPINNVQFDEDEELLGLVSKASNLHARLKPYIKQCVKECSELGTPVMRPLFYHYDEPTCYTCKDEYLLGKDILVAPIMGENKTSRSVFLPNDIWVNAYNGHVYHGGHHTIETSEYRPCVFVRKNTTDSDEFIKIIQNKG